MSTLRKLLPRMPALLSILLALWVGGPAGRSAFSPFVNLQAAENPSGDSGPLSPRLQKLLDLLGSDDLVPVIVTTTKRADDSDEGEARGLGATVHRRFDRLDGYAAWVPAGSLKRLAHGKNVARISYDLPIRSFNDLNYVTVGADLAARSFGAGGSALDGSGVTVAVVDSGIAAHPDLGDRLVAEVEIVGHEQGFADPYGHGTHVAGIIAGDGTLSSDAASHRRFNGLAPRANLVSVRVLDANGGGRVSDVMAGIDWVVAHRDRYGIRVLNLSLGHPVDQSYVTDPLCQAAERAWNAGIVVVAAAGNGGADGYATIHSPGNDPAIITVGASNNFLTGSRADDLLTTYTSRGPTPLDHVVKPDLVAPGNRTISLRAEGSTLDTLYPALRVKQGVYRDDPATADLDSPYYQLSGSSMAAGVVSGMAALMIQSDPSITPDAVKARLMKSAEKHPGDDLFSEGAGYADLFAALEVAGTPAGPAVSPTAVWTETGLLLQVPATQWQAADFWSTSALYGPDPLRGTGAVWADAAIWDAASPSAAGPAPGNAGANSVVWGGGSKKSGASSSSVVWGGGSLKADSVVWGGGSLTADSVVWGGGSVAADSVVWGGGSFSSVDTTLAGDNVPPAP